MTEKIYKVFHTLGKNGKYAVYTSDLQYDEGIPYAVLEWLNTHEGEIPSVRVPLDPKYLHKLKSKVGKADYCYEMPLDWPEKKERKVEKNSK